MHEEEKGLRTKMFGPFLGPSSLFLLKAMHGRVHARADSSACSALLGCFALGVRSHRVCLQGDQRWRADVDRAAGDKLRRGRNAEESPGTSSCASVVGADTDRSSQTCLFGRGGNGC